MQEPRVDSSTPKWPKFKVRTGCITCKIRRVKCDETKPACKRCSSTGRKCDGYENPDNLNLRKKTKKQQSSLATVVRPHSTPIFTRGVDAHNISAALPNAEYQWLQYFSQHAGPALCSLLDTDFWSRMLPQFSIREPAIRYALLALSTSYANVEIAQTTGGTLVWNSSVNYYNQAISKLQTRFSEDGSGNGKVEVSLICCLLFICLELLYEDRLLVLGHLESGLKLLDSLPTRAGDGTFPTTAKHKLHQIFTRLEAQSTLYGKLTVPRAVVLHKAPTQISKEPMLDFIEAKKELDNLTSLNLTFIKTVLDGTFPTCCPDISPLLFQRRLQEHLINWNLRFDNLQTLSPAQDIDTHNLATVLRVQQLAGFVYLSAYLEKGEDAYDSYGTEFASILQMVRSLDLSPSPTSLPSPPTTPSPTRTTSPFSLEYSVLPPLYLVAVKCRDPQLRREAIRLLETHPGRKGMFDPEVNSRVARRCMEIEEGGLPPSAMRRDGPLAGSAPETEDGRVRVDNADVERGPLFGARCARVAYNAYIEDAAGGREWVVWSEDVSFED